VSNDDVGLRRITAIVSDNPAIEDVLVGAYSRFVLVGADGVRLHEEVLYAGGWAPENGRFRRLENLTRWPEYWIERSPPHLRVRSSVATCRLTLAAYFRRSGQRRSTGAPKTRLESLKNRTGFSENKRNALGSTTSSTSSQPLYRRTAEEDEKGCCSER